MKHTKENPHVPSRTCAHCGKELDENELKESTEKGSHMGHHYCSDHLQPALNGEYLVKVVPNE